MPVEDPDSFELHQALTDLKGFNPKKKGDAAAALGVHGDESHVSLLKEVAGSDSEYVRVSALYGLTLLGERSALKDLLEFFTSSREYARKLALTAWEETTELELDADPENEETCETAREEASDWWDEHEESLAWNKEERIFQPN